MRAASNYRQKQAFLCILVFLCLAVAFLSGSALVTVGAVLAATGLCFLAAFLEPPKAPEEHHHSH
jgi:hypothetical protein